jgi:endo-1,4-beta-xylanase
MFETAARKYNTLGIELQLTELDIKQPDGSSTALTNQATRYKLLIDKVVNLKKEGLKITAVIFWGVTDATSWLGGYPLLFDASYKAKPSFYSIIKDWDTGVTTTPTVTPTITPTITPTVTPTVTPTITPTVTPTITPTITPTVTPTVTPTITPTITPTVTPTVTPTSTPTVVPTGEPVEGVPVVEVSTANNGNYISQKYTVSASQGTIDVSKVLITFTGKGMSDKAHNFWCDHAALKLSVSPFYKSLNGYVAGNLSNKVLTLSISKSEELAAGTGNLSIEIRFAKTDWSTYDTITDPVVKVYYNGKLVE